MCCVFHGHLLLHRDVKAGNIPIVCVCPETIMQEEYVEMFKEWGDTLAVIVLDEVHMIFEEWRSDYKKVPSLRAWFAQAAFLALTATAYVVRLDCSIHILSF